MQDGLTQRRAARGVQPQPQGKPAALRSTALDTVAETLNAAPAVQRVAAMAPAGRSDLPGGLRAGIEALSGVSMAGVRVHRNSSRPAQLQAEAFAQGSDIHLAPGKEHHLPHEAWHVTQQAKGRVKPTMQMAAGTPVNDEPALESEATQMGAKAAQVGHGATDGAVAAPSANLVVQSVAQRALVKDSDILEKKGTKYDWVSFRGTRTNQIGGGAEERGRGANLATGQKFRSHIIWGPIDPLSGEGTAVTAQVGPDHHLGSSPKVKNALARVAAFGALSKRSYISGHLLTEKLGGPGTEARNLTAISGSANTTQSSSIEEAIRVPVNERGEWMYYHLAVTYTNAQQNYDDDDPQVQAASETGAKGFKVEAANTLGQETVTLRYASQLTASWHLLDVDGGAAGPTRTMAINIPSPFVTSKPKGKATATKVTMSGGASGKQAAVTHIDAEELVLTTNNLLKHLVDSRKPLIDRIKLLRANMEALEGSKEDAEGLYNDLLQEVVNLGYRYGRDYGISKGLEKGDLSFDYGEPEVIDLDEYYEAFEEGRAKGGEIADAFLTGRTDGKDDGWSDNLKHYKSQEEFYKQGYDKGYAEGLAMGDYSPGRQYFFHNITFLLNRHEWQQNNFSTVWGLTVVRLTGQSFAQGNGLKWYEVQITAAQSPALKEEIGLHVWMKRRWLNKGQ